MPDEDVLRVLPNTYERTARVLAAVLLMKPDEARKKREIERLASRFGVLNAALIWARAEQMVKERDAE